MSASGEVQPLTPFDELGGQGRVRAVVERFYDLMDSEPEFAQVRAIHPVSQDASRDKLFWFLCGWLGGPALYLERVGQPMLRARHLPFPIGLQERDQWLACMERALIECAVAAPLRRRLLEALFSTADWMRNRPEAEDEGAPRR